MICERGGGCAAGSTDKGFHKKGKPLFTCPLFGGSALYYVGTDFFKCMWYGSLVLTCIWVYHWGGGDGRVGKKGGGGGEEGREGGRGEKDRKNEK